jgi:hypothetical protein
MEVTAVGKLSYEEPTSRWPDSGGRSIASWICLAPTSSLLQLSLVELYFPEEIIRKMRRAPLILIRFVRKAQHKELLESEFFSGHLPQMASWSEFMICTKATLNYR